MLAAVAAFSVAVLPTTLSLWTPPLVRTYIGRLFIIVKDSFNFLFFIFFNVWSNGRNMKFKILLAKESCCRFKFNAPSGEMDSSVCTHKCKRQLLGLF